MKLQLGDIAEVFNGKTPAMVEQRATGHPVLKIKDVSEDGSFLGSFNSFVDDALAEKFKNKWLQLDDSLILNSAHNADYVGSKTFLSSAEAVGALPTGEWLIVRADRKCADKRYIYHWLASAEVRRKIKDCVKGIHLYPRDVAALSIDLPDLPEQKRIAAILDKADSIRRKRQQAIQLADEFLRSVFLDLVGSPNINPYGFPMHGLGYYFDITTGKLDANRAIEGGVYPFFTCSRGDFWIDEYAFDTEAILLAGNNANADYSVKYFKGKFNAYQRTYVMTLKDKNHSYPLFKVSLEHKLHEMKRNSKGTNTKYLTLGILNDISLPLPPAATQRRFESIYKKYSEHRSNLVASLRDAVMCVSSLTQLAFQGKL